MYQNAVQGMFQSNLSGELIRVNPSYARILGYDSTDEVLLSIGMQ
jgi:PAS domain-containing protein